MLYKFDELKALDTQQKNKNLIEVLQRFAQMGTFRIFVQFLLRISNEKNIHSSTSEEILDAEENFFLGDELESTIEESNTRYSGLKTFNKTRWGSHLMMSRSQHKNNGIII